MLLDRRQGSKMGRTCIPRNRALGHDQLMQDYFAEVPTYPPRLFRRRYRMRPRLICENSERLRGQLKLFQAA
jgi:hypothetical protein